ncbi:hypothetical protein MTF65_18600 [Streptomyces sp. APSN-46.1]|uniref:hypothetical protein n=1 Tax=Streptomyces sp. APSN-46.1 TaxID=2929049 RepID=UPI001FB407F1|nr:hypothetical protein [Streptomyces sp. APSN-46.1]MCJ1679315.1 hypothetical protein [Streptomyces sp. APSN-46.1]
MASRTGMTALAALAAATALALPAGPAGASPGPGGGPPGASADPAVWADLTRATLASGRYTRESAAVDAGYVPDTYCVSDPTGSGDLGYPHFNHAYDNSLDPERPTALLYEDDASGRRRLVALEWVVMDRDGKPETDDDRPSLFGQPFKGPIPGRFKGQKVHYALHVWLWKPNPAGMFATFNPAVRCRPGTTRP